MAFELRHGRERAQQLANQRAALQAQAIRTAAIKNTPVDTGRLRQSIGVKKIGEGHYRVGTNVEYAPYVEYGRRGRKGTPFMRPAVEEVRGG